MIVPRVLTEKMRLLAAQLPVVSLTGPRQSGKSTLARLAFPSYRYVNLEDPELRQFALHDPKGFLLEYPDPVIIDEAQYAPDIFSCIQVYCDRENREGMFILTGSQDFLLSRQIAQTLAGRVATLHLLPLSIEELAHSQYRQVRWEQYLVKGFYPRIYDKELDWSQWYGDYVRTYLERDVRDILTISDVRSFQQFLALCAGRIGQLVNFSSIGNDMGVSYQTIKRWLNILETTNVVILLRPYHNNFNKRIVKSPKLYFNDPGLAAYLLGVRTAEQVATHYSKGALFENMLVAEAVKHFYNRGLHPPLFFWRDATGVEIDLVVEKAGRVYAVEMKSSRTFDEDFLRNMRHFQRLTGEEKHPGAVIYGGESTQSREAFRIVPWDQIGTILQNSPETELRSLRLE